MSRSGMGWFPRCRRVWLLERARVVGWVNLGDLVETFGVSRSQASADFAEVLASRPNALQYDLSQRCYLWTGDDMAPAVMPVGIAALDVSCKNAKS